MKRFVLVLSILFLVTSLCIAGSWVEKTCSICGKIIEVEEAEVNYFGGDSMSFSFSYSPSNAAKELSYKYSLLVCKDCYSRYSSQFMDYMTIAQREYIDEIKEENKIAREINEKIALSKKQERLEKDLEKIKKELRELKCKK